MECLRCGCCCFKRPASALNIDTPNRPLLLEEIEGSLKHKLALIDWNAQLTTSCNNLVRKLSSRNSSRSDLYQILGLFFVFEGVVITAAAQSSTLKCHNSWPILALSALVSVATLIACIQKLKEIAEGQQIYMAERALCSALSNSIEELKWKGEKFDLVVEQPKLGDKYTDQRGDQSPDMCVRFWKTWVWSYAGAVFFFLLAFSGVTLTAVRLIVCDA